MGKLWVFELFRCVPEQADGTAKCRYELMNGLASLNKHWPACART